MSTMITFEEKELRSLAAETNSGVELEEKLTENLGLQPRHLGNPKESIKKLMDYRIGKFVNEFNGILLSYKNLRFLTNSGTIRNGGAVIQYPIQADYFIFRPLKGTILKGIVNKKCETRLDILVHRVFNVVIPRPFEEPANKWIGAGVQEGQEVMFRVVVSDLCGALPYIRGELNWIKVLLIVGIIVLERNSNYDELITYRFLALPCLAVGTGALIIFISVLGSFAAISDKFYFIIAYLVLMLRCVAPSIAVNRVISKAYSSFMAEKF